MKTVHDYQESLAKGQKGKAAIKQKLGHILAPSSRGCDFKNVFDGKKIKLKTDAYSTPKNFFIEWIRNDQTNEIGGPRKAKAAGAQIYAYFFEQLGTLYYFDNDKLIEYVEAQSAANAFGPFVEAINEGYKTLGWRVPIQQLLKAVPHLQVDIADPYSVEWFTEALKDPLREPTPAKKEPKAVKSIQPPLVDLLG